MPTTGTQITFEFHFSFQNLSENISPLGKRVIYVLEAFQNAKRELIYLFKCYGNRVTILLFKFSDYNQIYPSTIRKKDMENPQRNPPIEKGTNQLRPLVASENLKEIQNLIICDSPFNLLD